jgi:hypothetical protein
MDMGRPSSGRNRNLRLIVSEDELSMVHTLAETAGVTKSDIIRLLVREAFNLHEAQRAAKRAPRKGAK